MRSAKQQPWYGLFGQRMLEPAMHFVPYMLPIAQTILHKGNLIAREQVKIAPRPRRLGSDGIALMAHVPPVP